VFTQKAFLQKEKKKEKKKAIPTGERERPIISGEVAKEMGQETGE
jgi:hypothetical protein